MDGAKRILWMAGVLAALLCGCRTDYTRSDQEQLRTLYYSNRLADAAAFSMKMSDAEDGETSRNALLWHLEAGSVNLDAGNFDEALTALERAEKLLWLFDRQGHIRCHEPGALTYRGYRSDRMILGMLKFFAYFSKGELEDALVEVRRIRSGQYQYLLRESDPHLREYDRENYGKKVPPYRIGQLMRDNLNRGTFEAAGMQKEFGEYHDRLRPQLAALFNPLAFYLSAVGYYWDNEFDEAALDLKYLHQLQPGNELFNRDYATVLRLLDEKLPPELEKTKPWNYSLTDDLAVVILAQGVPPGWKDRRATVRLPDYVPGHWKFSEPEFVSSAGLRLSAAGGGETFRGSELADLNAVFRDEFWQLTMPSLVRSASAAIKAMTAENNRAKVALAALLASKDFEGKALAVAAAQARVASTSSVSIDETDWRRWVTVAQQYQVLHLPIPQDRKVTVEVADAKGKTLFRRQLEFDRDTTRAVVYVREIGGKFHLKQWSTME